LRLEAVRELRNAGIAAGVFAMPVLPGLTMRKRTSTRWHAPRATPAPQWFAARVLYLMPSAQKQFLPFLYAKFQNSRGAIANGFPTRITRLNLINVKFPPHRRACARNTTSANFPLSRHAPAKTRLN